MQPYRIVLADSHRMMRIGLKKIIEGFKNILVVGEADDGMELMTILKKVSTDMVILGISMPKLRGIEAIHEIKHINPIIKIMILTMHKSKEYLYQAISEGADGYLLKDDSENELFAAINTIKNNNIYLSPKFSKNLTYDFVENCRKGNGTADDSLTPREKQVLKLIAEGNTCKKISNLLFISIKTAQRHRANLLEKLNIKNMPELVKYAMLKGYISNIIEQY